MPGSALPSSTAYATHEVLNQPPPLADYDAFGQDKALFETVERYGASWARDRLARAGTLVGSERVQTLARQANRNLPELRTHDRFGNRIDQIEFHPAWHELMGLIFGTETHSLAWTAKRPAAQVARAALSYLWNQGENGICCPMGMTYASVPVLRKDPDVAAEWEPRVLSTRYDPRPIPATSKTGCTVGMAMTEKQGGSDLRATITTARPANGATGLGAEYLLTGHKWFFSVPQSDVFLTLAQTDKGLSCFVLPGWLPDGSRNRIVIQRLKDKCGNKSNASSEIEYRDAWGRMLGEEGRGIRTIIEMAHLTRLDFAVGSAGLMRQALSQAVHHCVNRRAFQRALADQPIMRAVLADLAVEVEACTAMAFRFVAALDRETEDEAERRLARIGAPIAKYWNCKRAPAVVAEALECHGGNGFIEDHLMARLYREAPLNGIWEGSGNVICLDVLRSMQRDLGCIPAYLDEVRQARG
ncbi:MAG: acyl-CoA dehydrogenase family protein, partial [Pseudomonadota bacterium]|nr:acyl-CoA dehydrogenase family protein [Pseudomonadota bacterium]